MITFKTEQKPNCIGILTAEKVALVLPAIALEDSAHPSLDLCLHKGVEWDIEWVVSERSTGMRIAHGDTQGEAIEMASARLATKTDDEIVNALEKGRQIVLAQVPA